MADHERTLQIEYVDISAKTKFILTRFCETLGVLKLDVKCFSNTLLGFTSSWNYKTTMVFADSLVIYTSKKTINISTIKTFALNCDASDSSVVIGV